MLPLLEFPPPYEAVDPHLMVYTLGNIKLSMNRYKTAFGLAL